MSLVGAAKDYVEKHQSNPFLNFREMMIRLDQELNFGLNYESKKLPIQEYNAASSPLYFYFSTGEPIIIS